MSRVINYSGVTPKENRVVFKTRYGGRRVMDHVFAGEHQAVPYSLRLFFYIFATVLLVQSIALLLGYMEAESLFLENGMMEWAQIVMLLICVVLFQIVAQRTPEIHEGAHLVSFLPLLACVRELDHVFDTQLFDGAWQLIATGLLLYLIGFTLRHWPDVKRQTLRILAIPSTGLFFAGFLMVLVFSRLFGQRSFWELALQEDNIRLISRIAEESCETFGYLLLVFGCIELLIFALSCKADVQKKYFL